ncbi:MAG: hypothetical protein V2A58_18115 [Planctomycetota bacterium]
MRDLRMDSTNLYVRDLTQTFIDSVVIESVQDVTRRWHTPERAAEEPVIRRDRPWEHVTYFTYSNYAVLRDGEDGLLKCWYEDLEIPAKRDRIDHYARQLYAESEDGIHWRKPELDVLEIDGRRTNIVLGGGDYGEVHSASYVIDPHPAQRDLKFRTLYSHMWDDGKAHRNRIECAHSRDGIHWTRYEEFPRFGMSGPRLNDVSVLFYDEDAHEFVQNTRHFLQWAGAINLRNPHTASFLGPLEPHNPLTYNQRRVWQTRSHDFLHWSELVPAAATDEEDNLDEFYYGMAQFRLGSVYLATVGVLRAVDNEMDVQLLLSRDGIRWSNTNKRQPFLAPRGEGHWDAHMVSLVSPPIEMGDKLYFFHGGTSSHHDWWIYPGGIAGELPPCDRLENVAYGLGLATLRKDGYAGLYANRQREGTVVTRALISLGTKLVINARCAPGGSIVVEIADRRDEAIAPCTRENCDPFRGDSVAHTVTWKGDALVPAGRERHYWRKVRFFLRDAELFSFRFAEEGEEAG